MVESEYVLYLNCFILGARVSIEGTVELKKIDHIDFSKLQSFEEVTAAAASSDIVHQLEEVLMIWYKQIEQVSCLNIYIIWYRIKDVSGVNLC